MASLSTSPSQFSEDMTWDSLKRAIATSSGFKRWHLEQAAASPQVQPLLARDARDAGLLEQSSNSLQYIFYPASQQRDL
jgi:hypothetical protein